MRLQKRLAIYVISCLIILLGVFYFVFRGSVLSNIQYVEQRQILIDLDSCVKHINLEVSNLEAFLELSQYAVGNLSAASLSKQKIDFIAITGGNNGLVYGAAIDHEQLKKDPLTGDEKAFAFGVDKSYSGISVIGSRVYIVASKPVSDGIIVVGRELSADWLNLNDYHKVLVLPIIGSYDYFEGSSQSFIDGVSDSSMKAIVAVKDIHNKPAIEIAIESKRDIYGQAKQKISYLFGFLFIVSLLLGVGIVVLLRKIVYLQQRIFYTSRLASLGTLGTGIAHELNNPLAVIYGYAQNLERLIQEKQIKDPECSDGVSKILTYTNRMRSIVEKIGIFSTTDKDLKTSKAEEINSIINGSLMLIRKELEMSKISLSLKLNGKLPKITVNPVQMETVLHNIIVNSKEELESMPTNEDKKITITSSADRHNCFVVVKITDNGKGIPQENIFRVFDPFFTTKAFGKATGLGLSIVHGIMRDIGGKVEIDTKEKVGTTVILKIPANFEDCNKGE